MSKKYELKLKKLVCYPSSTKTFLKKHIILLMLQLLNM